MIFLSDNGVAFYVEGPKPLITEEHVACYYQYLQEQKLEVVKAARVAEWEAACNNDYW